MNTFFGAEILTRHAREVGSPYWTTAVAEAYGGKIEGTKAITTTQKRLDRVTQRALNHHNLEGCTWNWEENFQIFGVPMGPKAFAESYYEDKESKPLNSELTAMLQYLKTTECLIQVGPSSGSVDFYLTSCFRKR